MTIEIFIRHVREDEKLCLELESHLKPLERTGLITVYHEGKVRTGYPYKHVIHMHMQSAHIILPLISRYFVASASYVEMEQALQEPQQVSARIIPIILRQVDWQIGILGDLKALPENNIPVKNWHDRDYAWTIIAQHIRAVVVELSST